MVFAWQKLYIATPPMEVAPNTTEGNTQMGVPPLSSTMVAQPNSKTRDSRGRDTFRRREKHDDVPYLSQQRLHHVNP